MDLLIREMTKASEWPKNDVRVFRSYKEAVGWLGAFRCSTSTITRRCSMKVIVIGVAITS
ncbi:MAG: hypothetical protein ACI9HY_001338 [Planctomycetaceae bacterium]|jgi:hypothetical protein